MMRKKLTPLQRLTLMHKQNYKCARCKQLLPPLCHADHIIPLHQGGKDCWKTNVQILDPGCHAKKCHEELLDVIDKETLYDVVAIHGEKRIKGRLHYEVQWEGYRKHTWEVRENIVECEAFLNYLNKKQQGPKKLNTQQQRRLRSYSKQ